MADFTDLVSVMNEVHKDKGGTYSGDTAELIMVLAGQFYSNNKLTIREANRDELYNLVESIYTP